MECFDRRLHDKDKWKTKTRLNDTVYALQKDEKKIMFARFSLCSIYGATLKDRQKPKTESVVLILNGLSCYLNRLTTYAFCTRKR